MKHVHSKDPRKALVARWFKKYKGATKVTLVTFDEKQRTFSAHLLQREPGLWSFKALGYHTISEELLMKEFGQDWLAASFAQVNK